MLGFAQTSSGGDVPGGGVGAGGVVAGEGLSGMQAPLLIVDSRVGTTSRRQQPHYSRYAQPSCRWGREAIRLLTVHNPVTFGLSSRGRPRSICIFNLCDARRRRDIVLVAFHTMASCLPFGTPDVLKLPQMVSSFHLYAKLLNGPLARVLACGVASLAGSLA
jgi:hypothetical protein